MKRLLSGTLAVLMALGLCGCGSKPDNTAQEPNYTATEAEIQNLEKHYQGRTALHGDLHDHAAGEGSDGKRTLLEWKRMMQEEKDMDFAAIVNHRQLVHMRQPEWDEQYFIGGSEPGANIYDLSVACKNGSFDYSMIITDADAFEEILTSFPGFSYKDGFFKSYGINYREEFCRVVEAVQQAGGFVNFVHPLGDEYLASTDPLDYWFGDNTGFELINGLYGNMSARDNQEARLYWIKLLDLGKRVFATAGSDSHQLSNTATLTTVYSPAQNARDILDVIRTGDFTAGPASIRMCMGDTITGGVCSFEGQRLTIAVGDVHSQQYRAMNKYRVEVYTDAGLVLRQELPQIKNTEYLSLDVDPNSRYYRVEIYNVTEDYIFAIGNPIWNLALYTGEVLQ